MNNTLDTTKFKMKFKIKFKFFHLREKEIKIKKEKTNDKTRESIYKYQQLFKKKIVERAETRFK